MQEYNLSSRRLFGLMFLPTFFLIIIGLLYVLISKEPTRPSLIDWLFIIFFLIFWVAAFLFLFKNHYPIAKEMKLMIQEKELIIKYGEKNINLFFSDIKGITEFSSNRLPWRDIMWWKIELSTGEKIKISSLTISQFNFEKYFYNKIIKKFSFFPIIKD